MRLVLSGGWLGREGIYEAKIKRVRFLHSHEELSGSSSGFVVLSYALSSQTLRVPVKASGLPAVIYLELEGFYPLSREPEQVRLTKASSSFSPEGYMHAVRRTKDFIADGVVYQLNLTCRFDFLLEGSPLDLFLQYYRNQPVPY
ncbi:MAG: anthranilate synthase component I family protein, partial [Aquificota bacterium]